MAVKNVGHLHDAGLGAEVLFAQPKMTEAALRFSEMQHRALLEAIPDLVWFKDKDGVYLSCNPAFERLFGASEEEIVSKTDFDFKDRETTDFFRR